MVTVATDLLALTLIKPPGEFGADIAVGSAQRFGIPLGYGGPHAAFFATRDEFKRQLPGRLVGVSKDLRGRPALRLSLGTREQHIRRERATSNICTAQALLANIAAMYAVYHGPERLRAIASRVHALARALDQALRTLGLSQVNSYYFDTLRIDVPSGVAAVRERALAAGINFRYIDDRTVSVALNETVTTNDVRDIVASFAGVIGKEAPAIDFEVSDDGYPSSLRRTSRYLTHPVFNTHRSETEMMRYIRSLERKDIGLDTSMIPLGSCTMKLNAATEMIPVTWEHFSP